VDRPRCRPSLAGTLAAVLATVLLAGTALAQPKTTLKMVYPGWDSKVQEEAVRGIVADFQKQNPDIAVEIINIPFALMHDKLIVSLRSGDAPDLGYILVRWMRELQQAGFLADMTALANSLDRGDWVKSTWDPVTVGGTVHGIADRVDPWMMFYNKDLFAKAGIKEFPSTMEDFVAAAQKLTTGKTYGFGLVGAKHGTLMGQYLNFLYAFHGNLLTPDGKKAAVNDDNGVAALQFYTDMHRKHKIAQPSAPGDSRNEVRQLFFTEQVAMMVDGPWATGTFREMAPRLNWGVGKIPQVAGKPRRSPLSAWYYTTFASSKNKEAAAKLIAFMLRPENEARGVVTLPAQGKAAKLPRFATAEWAPWLDAARYADPEPSTEHYNAISDIMGDAIQEVLHGKKTAKQAADDAAGRVQRLIK
jgi:ABC-type glycerol-3-phosphate transport system substrate-binding protein